MKTAKRKIATFATIASLAIFGLVYGFAFPATVWAWDNCPKGLVNDPYPGACSRYVDTNDDGICDLSQPKPVESTTTTTVAPTTTTTTKETSTTTTSLLAATTTSGEPPTGDCPLGPCAACGACLSLGFAGTTTYAAETAVLDNSDAAEAVGAATLVAASGSGDTTTTVPPTGGSTDPAATTSAAAVTAAAVSTDSPSFLTHYLVSPIALGFFLIYGVSFFLYKTKRMRIATHRKIWNVLLLATFLVTGIFGVILAIQLDYELPFKIPIDLLFWHVEAGIAMTLISLFHMGWHFNYYRNLLRTGRSKVRAARAVERLELADQRLMAAQAREQRRAEREQRRSNREAAPVLREAERTQGEARRGAAPDWRTVSQRAAEPERAARAPRPWDDSRS